MTKQFDVIPIEDYYVVVDEKIYNGDRLMVLRKDILWGKVGEFCTLLENRKSTCRVKGANGFEYLAHCDIDFAKNDGTIGKVIATIGKRIEDIPLIEIPDEARQLAEKKYPFVYDQFKEELKDKSIVLTSSLRSAFEFGFKEAQSKGTYTEEDMREYLQWYGNLSPKEKLTIYSHEGKQELKVWESLQKKKVIKAVVLEGSYIEKWYDKDTGAFFPDTSETNTITPKEVIYN